MKRNKQTLTATLPNGYVATRTTANEYNFVVCVQGATTGEWGDLRWTTRRDLADKAVKEFQGWQNPEWRKFEIVSVN